MRFILLLLLLLNYSFASMLNITSFQADFTQTITDEKKQELSYRGNVTALQPQYALWKYQLPIEKSIYVEPSKIIIIEPEIEQVIIKEVASDFDFFRLLKSAKKVGVNTYVTFIKGTKYLITIEKNLVSSISYKDELDNSVKILFTNQKQNIKLSKAMFIPIIPDDYDVIR